MAEGLDGRRVLVVEDEFLVALDVEDALRDLGCEVQLLNGRVPGAETEAADE